VVGTLVAIGVTGLVVFVTCAGILVLVAAINGASITFSATAITAAPETDTGTIAVHPPRKLNNIKPVINLFILISPDFSVNCNVIICSKIFLYFIL